MRHNKRPIHNARAQSNPIELLEERMLLAVGMDGGGWTVVTPSADTQVIYVSNSQGSDTNSGLSASSPVQTIAKGISLLRNGMPDWLLLKRGDAWNERLGSWKKSGRSADEPMLVSSYGSSSVRPQLNTPSDTGMVLTDPVSYVDIIGLSFTPQTADTAVRSAGIKWLAGSNGFLVEDCSFRDYYQGIVVEQALADPISNVSIRRSQILDSFGGQGIFMDRVSNILLEENLLDHNGWNSALGTSPNIFNHDVYLTGSTSNVTARGNIFANASSHGLQARSGGQIIDNLFIDDPIGMSFGHLNGSGAVTPGGVTGAIRGNVFLGGRDISGAIRGWAIEIGNTKPGGGTVIEDNVVAHDVERAFPAVQFTYGSVTNPEPAVGINDLTVQKNIIYDWYGGFSFRSTLEPGGTGISALNGLTIRDNQVQQTNPGPSVNHASPYDPLYETWSNNQYFNASDPAKWFKLEGTTTSFSQWKSAVEPAAISQEAAYPDPTRSIGAYNATLGGAATVDAFLAAARRQSHLNWDTRYTALPVINYIREGFGSSPIASTWANAAPIVDTTPPTATLSASPITTAGATTYKLNITYSDNVAIDAASIDRTDIMVAGPGGWLQNASFVTVDAPTNGSPRTATYTIYARGGTWDVSDNGVYAVSVRQGRVRDTSGNYVPAGAIGTFTINIPSPTLTTPALTSPSTAIFPGVTASPPLVNLFQSAIAIARSRTSPYDQPVFASEVDPGDVLAN